MDDVTRLLLSAAERHLPEGYKIVPAATPSPHAGVLEALKALAGIPFERFSAQERADAEILHHWESGIVPEVMPEHSITVGDVRRARAALAATERQPEKVERYSRGMRGARKEAEAQQATLKAALKRPRAPKQKPDGVTDVELAGRESKL